LRPLLKDWANGSSPSLPHFRYPISLSTTMSQTLCEIGSSLWCSHILRTKIRRPDGIDWLQRWYCTQTQECLCMQKNHQ
jgi:hypothetical protein